MTDLAPHSPNLPTRRDPRPVHDAVRDQLIEEITGDQRHLPEGKQNRLDKLHPLLDAATFNEVLLWLASAKRGALPTKRGYVEDITKIAAWACEHFGVRPVPLLEAMTYDSVTVFAVYMRSQGWAVRTQRRMLSALSSLFNYATKHGWPVTNPVDLEEHALPVGTSDNGRPAGATRVLSVTETARLRKAIDGAGGRLVFDLLCVQGLRESEVANARVEHVNRDSSPVVLKVQRKRGKWVDRPLSLDTQRLLDEWLDGRKEGPLVVSTRFQVIDMTRRWARRAGIPNPQTVTPHVLRAVAITALLDKGKPLQEVQAWAGHASAKTTQGYWERSNGLQRDAALSASLASLLDEAESGLGREQ